MPSDYDIVLNAVMAHAKANKLSLDEIGKLVLDYRDKMFKGLEDKLVKGRLGRSRESIVSDVQDRYRREQMASEQAYYADKLSAVPEFAVLDDEQRKEIASKIVEVRKPDWKAVSVKDKP